MSSALGYIKSINIKKRIPTKEEIFRLKIKNILIESKKKALKYLFQILLPYEEDFYEKKFEVEHGISEDKDGELAVMEATVNSKRLTYINLRDKNNYLLVAFPSLEMEVIREVANHFESKMYDTEYRRIERLRDEVYNYDAQDWGDYEMQRDELKALDEAEKELEYELRKHYDTCVKMLLVESVNKRRLHILNLL